MRGAGIREEGERTSSFVAGGKPFTFFFFSLAFVFLPFDPPHELA